MSGLAPEQRQHATGAGANIEHGATAARPQLLAQCDRQIGAFLHLDGGIAAAVRRPREAGAQRTHPIRDDYASTHLVAPDRRILGIDICQHFTQPALACPARRGAVIHALLLAETIQEPRLGQQPQVA